MSECRIVKEELPRLYWYKIVYVCEEINNKQKEPKNIGEIFGSTKKIHDLEQVTLDEETLNFVIWYKLKYLGITQKNANKKEVSDWIQSIKEQEDGRSKEN